MSDPRREIAAERLRNHRLEGDSLDGAANVARWLGALQAQEYAVARWSIGQRAAGLDEAAVDRALDMGSILRTHVLRDTWHIVAAEDIRWLLELTGPRILARNQTMHRREGLDERLLDQTDTILVETLVGGRQLTRSDVAQALARHGIEAERFRLAYILMHAELTGLICSGAMAGKQHTYALLKERAPQARSLDREAALAELARRYFTSRGPAMVEDLGRWASLTLGDARHAVALAGSALEARDLDGRTYYWSAQRHPAVSKAPRTHLIQGYDEYVMGYSASRDVIDLEGLASSLPIGARSMFTHAILVNGQVLGHWRRTLTAKSMTIEVQLARRFSDAETAALQDAVERYAAFVGLPASWTR